jgi:acyl dehydratase
MATRRLDAPPRILPLYARAAATMVPGAGRLPFLPGRGTEIPDVDLQLAPATIDPAHLAAYARVCGLRLRDELPATYLHVLAFPLHMALMGDPRFPFGAVGLVHVANRITQHRPVHAGERPALHVRATPLVPHPRGRAFTIVSEARVGDELVWEDASTILRRGAPAGAPAGDPAASRDGAPAAAGPPDAPAAIAHWRLPGDLGRRYARVSGDRNPIHLHDVPAKLLGFPRAIAHGMWTKARCLAALEGRLPAAYVVDVRFRRPVLLPSTVAFAADFDGQAIAFTARAARDGTPHLDGRVEPAVGA